MQRTILLFVDPAATPRRRPTRASNARAMTPRRATRESDDAATSQVADAVIKAIVGVTASDTSPDKVVVRPAAARRFCFRSDASSWLHFVRTRLRGCFSVGRVFVAAFRSDASSLAAFRSDASSSLRVRTHRRRRFNRRDALTPRFRSDASSSLLKFVRS